MDDKLVKIKSYERMDEALLDQGVLTDNGIECSIMNSVSAEILPMLYELDEGIALLVFENQEEKAREILKDYHLADITP